MFLPLLLLSGPIANAQLVNGSFENAGAPSLAGWEWTCGTPVSMNDPAPGSGSWSATKEAGQTQGCFPSYLYQRLSGVADGQLVTLSGWVRCDAAPICPGAWFGLGRVNSGLFDLEEQSGTSITTWTYFTMNDTVELAVGDTAIVVLTAGLVGGPAFPAPGHFDGMEVDLTTGMTDLGAWSIHHRFDANDHQLTVATGGPAITDLRVFDATGRETAPPVLERDRAQATFDTSGLGTGVYLVRLEAGGRDQVLRFVNP